MDGGGEQVPKVPWTWMVNHTVVVFALKSRDCLSFLAVAENTYLTAIHLNLFGITAGIYFSNGFLL